MRLSSENTAVVLDSTADLPDPQGRNPNWRMVPLYVQFGTETFRDYVDLS
nr:DegV family protein [Actinomycetota bacterium]